MKIIKQDVKTKVKNPHNPLNYKGLEFIIIPHVSLNLNFDRLFCHI